MIAPKVRRLATPLCYPSSERIECMRRAWAKGARRWTAVMLLIGGGAWPCVGQTGTSGPVVVGVRLVREDGTVVQDNPVGLPVETGKPLNRAQVAASLRALYKSGDYANLRAETTPVDGGVRLDFVAEENLY